MGILFILIMLLVPYMWGSLISKLLKDKDASNTVVYVRGIVAIFVVSIPIILATLKLDLPFSAFALIEAAALVMVALLGIFASFERVKAGAIKFKLPAKECLPVVIAASLLGVFSILVLDRSYVNDVTTEIVRTTLDSGKIYVYSSLTGAYMLKGLPIFNKVNVIPLLYAVLSKFSFTDINWITGLILPVFTYVINLLLVWEISSYVVKPASRRLFMFIHMVLLVAGTYLPAIAIPVSSGFTLLRQGFTGYTWAYAVIAPFIVLELLRNKKLSVLMAAASLLGVLKLDSVYFAFKDFVNSYHSIASGGKLWIMYLVCVMFFIYVSIEDKKKFPWKLLFSGCVLISAAITNLYESFSEKYKKSTCYAFLGWMLLAALASVAFYPFKGAKISFAPDSSRKEIREVVKTLENWNESTPISEGEPLVVCGDSELMSDLRRLTVKVRPSYGRDLYEPLLTGYSYEYPEEGEDYLLTAMQGIESDYKLYEEAEILEMLIENISLYYTDVIVFKSDVVITDKIWEKLSSYGFDPSNIKVKGDYQYIHR